VAKSFAYSGTNRLPNFENEKTYNKLDNKVQSLNIQTCETNTISKTKSKQYNRKDNFKNTKVQILHIKVQR
jgi:hypothetical protein